MKEKRQQVYIQLCTCHLLFDFPLLILHKRASTITIYFTNENSERVKLQWANFQMKWAIAHLHTRFYGYVTLLVLTIS